MTGGNKGNGTDVYEAIDTTIRWCRPGGIKEGDNASQPRTGVRRFRVLVPVRGVPSNGSGDISAHLFTMIPDARPNGWDSPPAA